MAISCHPVHNELSRIPQIMPPLVATLPAIELGTRFHQIPEHFGNVEVLTDLSKRRIKNAKAPPAFTM